MFLMWEQHERTEASSFLEPNHFSTCNNPYQPLVRIINKTCTG